MERKCSAAEWRSVNGAPLTIIRMIWLRNLSPTRCPGDRVNKKDCRSLQISETVECALNSDVSADHHQWVSAIKRSHHLLFSKLSAALCKFAGEEAGEEAGEGVRLCENVTFSLEVGVLRAPLYRFVFELQPFATSSNSNHHGEFAKFLFLLQITRQEVNAILMCPIIERSVAERSSVSSPNAELAPGYQSQRLQSLWINNSTTKLRFADETRESKLPLGNAERLEIKRCFVTKKTLTSNSMEFLRVQI